MPTDCWICEDMLPKRMPLTVLRLMLVLGCVPGLCTGHFTAVPFPPVNCDFSDPSCGWEWSDGFLLLSAENTSALGTTAPDADSEKNAKGQFLYYSATAAGLSETLEIVSPQFEPLTLPKCQLEMTLHMFNMEQAIFKVIMKAPNSTWESNIFHGDNAHTWRIHKQMIGTVRQPFSVILEVIVQSSVLPSHLAIDSIEAVDCYLKASDETECVARQFQCSDLICIDAHKVCDATPDCIYGEDEDQECDKLPEAAFCTFETNMCEWNSSTKDNSEWIRNRGESPNQRTGPSFDHTFQNASGTYLLAKFPPGRSFGVDTVFTSPWFSPPPVYHRNIHSQYYNTCQVRFYFHKFGERMGELRLNSLEYDPHSHVPRITHLWRSYGNKGNMWWQAVVMLPQISHRYQLQFIASRGMDHSDIAIDDITLSPECFNIGVPPNESIDIPATTMKPDAIDVRNPNGKRYAFSTCGARDRTGPNDTLCHYAYMNTSTKVTVLNEPTMEGIQRWTVPSSGLYTLFVRGAGGGSGVQNRDPQDRSLGTYLRATFDWLEGDVIYLLIGQKGGDACASDNTKFLHRMCETRLKRDIGKIRDMNRRRNEGGGGGGGGATYVFKVDPESNHKIPVAIAGGGGGLSAGVSEDENLVNSVPHGMGPNNSIAPINGYTGSGAGGGGGWDDATTHVSSGQSLREGGRGGEVCRRANIWLTYGGFGGGGGGCASGGGGGGYRGGDASPIEGPYFNGQGGTSYVMPGAIRTLVEPGTNEGDGSVTIIPAQKGCGCDYMCVMLDLESKAYYCICPADLTISIDGFTCNGHGDESISSRMVLIIVFAVIALLAIALFCIIFTTARIRKIQASRDVSHEPLNNPEVQLSLLRNTGGMVTEYNPNYEFGGSTCTAQDLREVPRAQLSLVKALGQGAFGEVYQGYLTNPNSDNSERPVAVKTLPELSSSQAEMDFLMEALIMSKFNHPNIVSFIGVCFEKLPRFIVLELLPGGDLKSFLRECRPKPSKQSTLTVTDLLKLAMDVAKGCQYLEENHFIHRDIAARNCLLSTKEANRVVKIADFGMARDIYGADYYRKGGKAMLPVKWMPPEAFLDGIFTSKTDVWSFGVLLWEVISLGYMPYPGRGNQEVMQLVTSGGRLEPPTNCPSPVYHIMMQCWHPHPDERPHFTTVIERLGYCLQDPDVINAPLPVFNRAPSMERDTTVMRPLEDDNSGCLQVHRPEPGLLLSPGSEDYLIPKSSCSMTSDRTDLQSSPGSSDQLLLEMGERGEPPAVSRPPEVWETKFMSPNCKPMPKKQKGYTEVPTEETEPSAEPEVTPDPPPPQKNGPLVANGPKKSSAARLSSIKSLDDLPVAPVANENSANVAKNQSNLSLDAGALVRQMANPAGSLPTDNPNRYVNVDVNCNTGSNSSLSGRSGLANRNPVTGPFDGYAGVNPVA